MPRPFTNTALALLLLVALAAPAKAATCKTLKGEWVGFGEESPRKEAESRLDKEVADWSTRYNIAAAKTRNRKVSCQVYIQFLNEYACTAEADVCR